MTVMEKRKEEESLLKPFEERFQKMEITNKIVQIAGKIRKFMLRMGNCTNYKPSNANYNAYQQFHTFFNYLWIRIPPFSCTCKEWLYTGIKN